MKIQYPITLRKGEKLTIEQAQFIFKDITAHEQRAEIRTGGPWDTIVGYRALCVRQDFSTGDITIYGYRRLQNIGQSGYELEGEVSINDIKRSAFTSSHLFELENGHLIDVAIIFPRMKEK